MLDFSFNSFSYISLDIVVIFLITIMRIICYCERIFVIFHWIIFCLLFIYAYYLFLCTLFSVSILFFLLEYNLWGSANLIILCVLFISVNASQSILYSF